MDTTPVLQMNFEQDSVGNQAWVAAFYTPESGYLQGRGPTCEAAVLDLAGKISVNKVKSIIPRIDVSQWRESMQKAMRDQPMTKADILGGAVPVDENDVTIRNVGKIVHYTPGDSDMFVNNGSVLPAIVTREWKGNRMDLQIFSGSGTHVRYSVGHSATPCPETWRWPKEL